MSAQAPDSASRTEPADLPGPPVATGEPGADAGLGGPRPRRRRRIVGAVLLAVALVWALGWHSPLTQVEHVVVHSPKGIPEAAVRLSSGISASDHVPAVDSAAVRLALMTAIPSIADVRVSRSLPSTITLTVTAREPFAVVKAGKGYYVMDVGGVVFDKVATPRGLPVITARSEVGREAAREVLRSMPGSLRADVEEIGGHTRDDVTLVLKDGATVRWGSAEDAVLKARVLAGLLVVKARRYDVSAPLLPTTSGTIEG